MPFENATRNGADNVVCPLPESPAYEIRGSRRTGRYLEWRPGRRTRHAGAGVCERGVFLEAAGGGGRRTVTRTTEC